MLRGKWRGEGGAGEGFEELVEGTKTDGKVFTNTVEGIERQRRLLLGRTLSVRPPWQKAR